MGPKVSIIVPCYNHAKYLNECLNSVRKQTYTNFQCIIVDDGSTDGTREVAAKACIEDPRFIYHFQENRGLSGARNTGLQIADGDLVNFLDADDALFPSMLSELVTEMKASPGLDLAYCGYVGSKQSLDNVVKIVKPGRDFKSEPFYRQLCKGNLFPVHAALAKKALFDSTGLFDETLKSCEDWDMWLRIARVTNNVKAIQEPLVIYRMVSESMTRNVKAFFDSGLIVLSRIPIEDSRVKNSLPDFRNGCSDYMLTTEKNWFRKAIGLYISKNDYEAAWILLVRLDNELHQQLDATDFLELWKNILFGAILLRERRQAWHKFGQTFYNFMVRAEGLYHTAGLAYKAKRKVLYYNAPAWKRAVLRIVRQ